MAQSSIFRWDNDNLDHLFIVAIAYISVGVYGLSLGIFVRADHDILWVLDEIRDEGLYKKIT